ncbi:hypothetical protein J7L97_00615 [Candidatus Bathyarchaeota archaeon]|nr:hypothetical protein [Candidatus Bathyarchaeota archaeon]
MEEALAELNHVKMAYQELKKEYETAQALYESQPAPRRHRALPYCGNEFT